MNTRDKKFEAVNIQPLRDDDEGKRIKRREYSKKYYETHKIEYCTNVIGKYFENSIERVRKTHRKEVLQLQEEYPFELYGDKYIKIILRQYGIYSHRYEWQDCYEAGMLAYIYSTHRCAVKKGESVKAYIYKMIKIYVLCALVINNNGRNICKENHFLRVEIDKEECQNLI